MDPELTTTVAQAFAENGPLAKALTDFRPRPQQHQLAEAIESAIRKRSLLVAEAPTGVGKTFAYLIPSILSGKKVVVTTGTKALQEQLFCRDLPKVLSALGVSIKVAMLKGRQNYLCHHKLHHEDSRTTFANKKIRDDFFEIKAHLKHYQQGDVTEHAVIDEDSEAWSHVVSTADSCLGQACEYFDNCFVVKARRKAQRAKIAVINHHLFFADALLKEQGFGEILPDAEVVIVDEAHQFSDIGRQFLGGRLSTHQLALLASALKALYQEQSDDPALMDFHQSIIDWLDQWRKSGVFKTNARVNWQQYAKSAVVSAQCDQLKSLIDELYLHLSNVSDRSAQTQQLHQRVERVYAFSNDFFKEESREFVRWVAPTAMGCVWHQTPLDLAQHFQGMMRQNTSYCFTSATLSIAGDFDYFTQQLGLSSPECLRLDTPYDFSQQARLYCPRYLPDPTHEDYISGLMAAVLPVINRLGGRTFLLFTSLKALELAVTYLKRHASDLKLLVQGQRHKLALLEAFTNSEQSVLLGCQSFWEGVDVPGPALSCVVIDKLPFEPPYDPVSQARAYRLRQAGLDPFKSQQLPAAVIALKQGLGRLIRRIDDKGLLVIGDPRLRARHYGKVFLDSLPRLMLMRDQHAVLAWMEECVLE